MTEPKKEDAVVPNILTSVKWAQFGQWALILGVLVWVLQVYTSTNLQIEEANRQERTEMRTLIFDLIEQRFEAQDRKPQTLPNES